MLDRTPQFSDLEIAPAPPVARYLIGRPVAEAVEILPRIFNLCRMAQEVAVKLAFDVTLPDGWSASLQADILREHQFRLGILLPGRLGLSSLAPEPWPAGAEVWLRKYLGQTRFAQTGPAFERYLGTGAPAACLLRAVDDLFGAGEACHHGLVSTTLQAAETYLAQDNTVAARHGDHPVMCHIEQTRGRGPLWQVVGRILDVESIVADVLPAPIRSEGAVFVPAARGLYVVRGQHNEGHVTDFARVTPTDHLLATGGVLDQALTHLPDHKAHLAPLVIDILDPCQPVAVKKETTHA